MTFSTDSAGRMGEAAKRYEIRRLVRQGGLAQLFLAYDRRFQREVALKLVTADAGDDVLHELAREAEILGGLCHPNIVAVHDCGFDEFEITVPIYGERLATSERVKARHECFYLVEDYIRGYDLSTPIAMLCAQGESRKLWPRRKLLKDYFLGALSGLAEAHRHRIVHRDVKPKNIMIDPRRDAVYLIDFGLAKRMADPCDAHRHAAGRDGETELGMVKGTPWYASPEQARGDVHEIDARSDIYSFGVTLYEAVTLHLPFEDRNSIEVLKKIAESEPPTLEETLAKHPETRAMVDPIPGELSDIIMRCLRREREARYENADALRRDLVRFLIHEAPLGNLRRWHAGEVVIRESERSDELYYLLIGRVAVEKGGRREAESGPGEWIGFAPIINAPRAATVRALEDCEAYVFSGVTDDRVLYQAIAHDPAMGVSLIKALARPYGDVKTAR